MTLVLPSPSHGERDNDDPDGNSPSVTTDPGEDTDNCNDTSRHQSEGTVSTGGGDDNYDHSDDDDGDDDDRSSIDNATNTNDAPLSVTTTNTGWNTTDIDDIESINPSQLGRLVDTIINSFTQNDDDETSFVPEEYDDDDYEEEEYDEFVVEERDLELAKNRRGLILSPNATRMDVSDEIILQHSMTWASTFGWNDNGRNSSYRCRGKDDERDLRMVEPDHDVRDLRIVESDDDDDDDESKSTANYEYDSRDDHTNDEEDGEYDEEETWDGTDASFSQGDIIVSMAKHHIKNRRNMHVSEGHDFYEVTDHCEHAIFGQVAHVSTFLHHYYFCFRITMMPPTVWLNHPSFRRKRSRKRTRRRIRTRKQQKQ
jgi:hypothetical protein